MPPSAGLRFTLFLISLTAPSDRRRLFWLTRPTSLSFGPRLRFCLEAVSAAGWLGGPWAAGRHVWGQTCITTWLFIDEGIKLSLLWRLIAGVQKTSAVCHMLLMSDTFKSSFRVSQFPVFLIWMTGHVTWCDCLQVWTGRSGLWSGWASTWGQKSTSSTRWDGTQQTLFLLPMDPSLYNCGIIATLYLTVNAKM